MFKKFLDGLAFGAGFAISLVAIIAVASWLWHPHYSISGMHMAPEGIPQSAPQPIPSPNAVSSSTPFVPFNTTSLEQRIRQASIIALARYEKQPDGKLKAVLKEFLKKEPGVEFYYKLGDEYPQASRQPIPDKNTSYGDGEIIFFSGSPAMMRESITFYGERIPAFGDLPLELFRKKCK